MACPTARIVETSHLHSCSVLQVDAVKDENGRLARWSLALQPYIYEVLGTPSGETVRSSSASSTVVKQAAVGELNSKKINVSLHSSSRVVWHTQFVGGLIHSVNHHPILLVTWVLVRVF